MFVCPACKVRLKKRLTGDGGLFWRCPKCDGRSVTIGILRKYIPAVLVNNLWQAARYESDRRRRPCPACNRKMAEVPVGGSGQPIYLDVCTSCQFVWFDPDEFQMLEEAARNIPVRKEPPTEAKVAAAMADIDSLQRKYERAANEEPEPKEVWQWIVGMFGIPVEETSGGLRSIPWVTWSLVLLISAISIISFSNIQPIIDRFGLIPAQWDRYGGATLLTSFFLHAGWIHLISNMYFLLVFGDNVEDWLGKGRFLLLLICADLVGNIAHIMLDPHSMIPCIGASGGISGVIIFYALKYPNAKLGFMMYFYHYVHWVRLPAMVFFFLWLVLQFLGAWVQIAGFSNVSSLAHLGGAAVGFLFFLLFDRRAGEK